MSRAFNVVVLIVTSFILFSGSVHTADIQRNTPKFKLKRDVTVRLDPAPVVQNWKPREKAYPGQSLFIRGGPYRISDLRAELVTARGRVQLPRGPANVTTAVFRITDSMYTGTRGARLIVKHVRSSQGGASQERVLDTNFQVLNREAVFRGPSLWHQSASTTSTILTEGKVSLRIKDLDFANAGTYFYQESVPLLAIVEEFNSKCKDGRKPSRPARRLDIRTRTFSRSGSWQRLPDGRIQLNNASVDLRNKDGLVVLLDLSGNVGRATFETFAPVSGNQRPRTEKVVCLKCNIRIVGVGFLTGLESVCNDTRPVGFQLRTIEWSLRRLDG